MIKVRDGLVDVKRLKQVDDRARAVEAGNEGAFPLAQADVVTVIEALGALPADIERAGFSHQRPLR